MGKKSAYTMPLELKKQNELALKSELENEKAKADRLDQMINNPQGYYADNTVLSLPELNNYNFSSEILQPETISENEVDGVTGAMNPNAEVGSTSGYDSDEQFRTKTGQAVVAQKLLKDVYGIDNLEQLENLSEEQKTNLITSFNEVIANPEAYGQKEQGYIQNFVSSSDPSKYFKVSDLEEDQKFWGPLFNQITGTKTFSEKPVVYSLQDSEAPNPLGVSKKYLFSGNNEYERAQQKYGYRFMVPNKSGKQLINETVFGAPHSTEYLKNATMGKQKSPFDISIPTSKIGLPFDIPLMIGPGTATKIPQMLKGLWRNPIGQTTGLNKLSKLTGISNKVPNIVKQGTKLISPRNVVNTYFASEAPEYLSEVPTNFSDAYSDFSSGNLTDGFLNLGEGALNASTALPFLQAGKKIYNFGNTIRGGKSYIPSTNLGKYSFTTQSPSGRTQFGFGAQGDPLTRQSILDLKLPGTQGRFNISKFNEKPGSSLLLEKTGGVIKIPKNKKLPKHNMRGIVKNLAKYYPDMEVAGSSLLTPDYVKRIQDMAKLKSFLTYASNIDKSLGKNREILNYNIGKQIVDGNINLEDVADSSSALFDYDIDPSHKARDIINQEGVESLLQKILRSTEQKDFSQLKPFGDIERSAFSRQLANQRYDHEKTMLDLYSNPNYNAAALPMESLGDGYDFTPDRDFSQQYFDLLNHDYDIANPFGDGSQGLGTIKDALPVFYAKNFENARQTATYGMESINRALHNARPRTFLTDAGSKTPDSYLMGANQLIKSMNTYPEILGNTQFIGYSSLNNEAFSDAFFRGKEKAINRGELRGPYTGAPRAVADSNLEFFNRLRGDYTSNALDKIYAKYNFEGLPAIRLPLSTKMTNEISRKNRGLGSLYSYKPGATYFPSYAVQKLRPMSLEEALKIKFEDGGYSLGDEVDEATMKELKKLGYTLEEA